MLEENLTIALFTLLYFFNSKLVETRVDYRISLSDFFRYLEKSK